MGGNVIPPIMIVCPPIVSVSSGRVYVLWPHTTTPPELVVVCVASIIDVVPLITLKKDTKKTVALEDTANAF